MDKVDSLKGRVNPLIEMVTNHLEDAQSRNPAFSLRAFAKKIGVSHSTLSALLNYKRPLSPTQTVKIAKGLGLNDAQIEQLQRYYFLEYGHFESSVTKKVLPVSDSRFFTNWYVKALFELVKLDNFKHDKNWMAYMLGVSNKEVEEAIEILKHLGLVQEEEGHYYHLYDNYDFEYRATSNDEFVDTRKSAKDLNARATLALENFQPEEFFSSQIIIPITQKDLPLIKKIADRFRVKVEKFARDSRDRKEHVYGLTVNCFPITRNSHS